ncbi:MAG: glycoside hydrolase family 88/105 protein [Terracidiphilus sp.]
MRRWSELAVLILLAELAGCAIANAQQQPPSQSWSVRAANAAMDRWPSGIFSAGGAPPAWTHDEGVLLAGIEAVWRNSVDRRDYRYIQHAIDPLIGTDGSAPALKAGDHRLGEMLLGRQLMLLYGVTLKKRYYDAATALYRELRHAPRNASGGFWLAQNQPDVMTLDSIDEAEPFYGEYARTFHHAEVFADITKQFVLMQDHARDAGTGLLRQGWDESKQAAWANKQTGESAADWARAMGWYMVALVDTIQYYPGDDPGRKQLIAILNEDAAAVARYQDAKSGLWWEVMDKAGAKGNYPEASASCLFVYAFAKGVRRGYLPERYDALAERGYRGVLDHFVTWDANGGFSLRGTAGPTDLGRLRSQDGSYAFYTGRKTVTDSPMGVGAFILASTEIENVKNAKLGRGDTVMVDGWFNSQKRMDPTGHEIYFHYKWNEESDPGFSLWGHAFRNFGARTTALYAEPTVENLQPAQVYTIASPDNLDKNPQAHFANDTDAKEIAKWVKAGGVLAILENDTSFADLDHFNVVSEKFGIHFNSVLRMHVVGTDWAMGRFVIDGKDPIFHHPHTAYVKDVCTISVKPPAVPVYTHDGDVFMAVAKYGKGTVYAMVDPWFYNEYTNGLKLPPEYDNYAAGVELAKWLLEQVPKHEESGIGDRRSGIAAAQR